jgi:hypothetical protein
VGEYSKLPDWLVFSNAPCLFCFDLLFPPCTQAVGYPADIIKTRIQASPNNHTMTIMGTAKELIQEANGRVIAGLYKGFGLKLVRSVPASMIGFTTYEWVAEKLRGSEN